MVDRLKGSCEEAVLQALSADDESHPLLQRMLAHNRIIKHNFRYNLVRRERCGLEGCCRTFELTLVPRQVLYPKFCESHRSEFRRRLHLRTLAKPSHDS